MVSINERTLLEVTGVAAPRSFECATFGAAQSTSPHTLAYLDTPRFAVTLAENPCVTVVLTTAALAPLLPGKLCVLCDEPLEVFFRFQNRVAEDNYVRRASVVSPRARVHPRAYVCEHNVTIEEDAEIGPNATVLADVRVGAGCRVGAGATLGGSGFQFKRTRGGVLAVFHDGEVRLGREVRVGSNCAIDKGFAYRHTELADEVKLDDLVYIAHGVHVGAASFLAAHVAVSGSTTIGARVWVGPGAVVSSRVRIGDDAFVTLGSVVSRDVAAGEKVTGNFAVPHERFVAHLRTVR
ncbi:MAG TPA: DapH/DapD/GlmU-related protein [Polyangiaceae bacterium]|nr:DapH/DapD/GlmU-related protein [Polyangiaceae bacterium]